jgi:hypothetical protein
MAKHDIESTIDHSYDDYLMFRIKDMNAYGIARAKIDTADDMFGDLPDGAYWAASEEFGAGQDLQLAVDVYERENKLGVHDAQSGATK